MRPSPFLSLAAVPIMTVVLSTYLRPQPEPEGLRGAWAGKSRAEVLERFGVPDLVGGGEHEIFFMYGEKAVIAFHEDQVFWVHPDFEGVETPRPSPEDGAYPGQSLVELLGRWGAAESFSSNAGLPSMGGGLHLAFPDKLVRVAHGVVLEVRNRRQTR